MTNPAFEKSLTIVIQTLNDREITKPQMQNHRTGREAVGEIKGDQSRSRFPRERRPLLRHEHNAGFSMWRGGSPAEEIKSPKGIESPEKPMDKPLVAG
jgi:hypothetical protein